jgi:hypothetical protein
MLPLILTVKRGFAGLIFVDLFIFLVIETPSNTWQLHPKTYKQ